MGIDRPLPSSPFFNLSSPFFDDGMNRLDRRRLLRDVVGVEVGVGKSFSLPSFGADSPSGCRLSTDVVIAVAVGGSGGAACGACCCGGENLAMLLLSETKDSACCEVPCDNEPVHLPGECCDCSEVMKSALIRIGMWWLEADRA